MWPRILLLAASLYFPLLLFSFLFLAFPWMALLGGTIGGGGSIVQQRVSGVYAGAGHVVWRGKPILIALVVANAEPSGRSLRRRCEGAHYCLKKEELFISSRSSRRGILKKFSVGCLLKVLNWGHRFNI
ncbi:hypothetical protein K438DRAFT_1776660 [Mycena galopus ATCC 62051]|nr:hypothetical protein K438DRAFT_1776660 [Mycena galopus ATCC 62051]